MSQREYNGRTILLAAWGHNNGHITHCVALGHAARRQGWKVVIAHHEDPMHLQLVKDAKCESAIYPAELLAVDDMWSCWHDGSYIQASVEADLHIMEKANPDVVVHDLRLSLPIAAHAAKIPHAAIAHQVQLPGFSYPALGMSSLWMNGIEAFNSVLMSYKQQSIDRDLRELIGRGRVLIPSVPDFDPIPTPDHIASVIYIGPLSAAFGKIPADLATDGNCVRDGVFLYRTVGINSSLPDFCNAFADLSDRVFIATGSDKLADELQKNCSGTGFRIRAFWNMDAIHNYVSVAVHHGGPGTVLSCVQRGIPAVTLPGDNPERCMYGEKLASLGLGVSLPSGASLNTSWHSAVDTAGEAPFWPDVRRLIDWLRGDREIRVRCHEWKENLAMFSDDAAIDIISALAWPPAADTALPSDRVSALFSGVTDSTCQSVRGLR